MTTALEQRHLDAELSGEAEETVGVLGQADTAVRRAAADAVLAVDRSLCRVGNSARATASWSMPSFWVTSQISFQKLIFAAL